MTDPAALTFRITVLEQKLDAFVETSKTDREADKVERGELLKKIDTLLTESNQWAGVRKTLAVLGSIILGLGVLAGVFFQWFFHQR